MDDLSRDVNAPYPQPPYSVTEYDRRLMLAQSMASGRDRISIEVERDTIALFGDDDEDWPQYYAWSARKLDADGVPLRVPSAIYDATSKVLTSRQLAKKIGWASECLEGQPGVEVPEGRYLADGDGWRFHQRRFGVPHLLAAE